MSNINRLNQLELGTELYYASGRRFSTTRYNKATVVKRTDRRVTLAVQFDGGVREITFGSTNYGSITRELKTSTNERPSEHSYLITTEEGERRIERDAVEAQHQAIVRSTKAAINDVNHSLSIVTAEAAIEALQAFVANRKAI